MDSPKYQGNTLSIDGKGYKRPRAPMKRYVQTIKVNKKDENENDSDADGAGGDDDTEITKSYTWDVDRTRDPQTVRTVRPNCCGGPLFLKILGFSES